MADTKISAMPAAATLTGTEIVPLVQSGVNKQVTTADFVGQVILTNPPTYRADLGLGTMAVQNANAVAVTGGAVNGTTIGGVTKAAGSFTTLTATGTTTLATSLTGYLKGTTGVVSAVTTIPWTDITGAPPIATSAYGAFYQDGVTALVTPISNGGTPSTITVDSAASFPSAGYVMIDTEVFKYTSRNGTTFSGISRNQLGSQAKAHSAGAPVSEVQATGDPTAIGTLIISGTTFSNNISISGVDPTQIVFANAGYYNVQFSAQCINYDGIANLTVWLAQNGTAIPSSASVTAVPGIHGNVPGATVLALNIFIQTVAPNEYIELKFATDSATVGIATYPEGVDPIHPSSPAVIVTANRVG